MIQEVPEVIQCHILSPCPTLPPMCLYLPVLISEINPTIHQFSIILVIKLLQTPWSPKLTSAVLLHMSNDGCWSPSGLNCFPLSQYILIFSFTISIRYIYQISHVLLRQLLIFKPPKVHPTNVLNVLLSEFLDKLREINY